MPSAVVVTDAFAQMGQATARSLGVPGLPMAALRHPFDYLSRSEVREAAEQVYDEVVHILTAEAWQLAIEYASKVWAPPRPAGVSCALPPGAGERPSR